jgi:hypothetical protein
LLPTLFRMFCCPCLVRGLCRTFCSCRGPGAVCRSFNDFACRSAARVFAYPAHFFCDLFIGFIRGGDGMRAMRPHHSPALAVPTPCRVGLVSASPFSLCCRCRRPAALTSCGLPSGAAGIAVVSTAPCSLSYSRPGLRTYPSSKSFPSARLWVDACSNLLSKL